MTPDGGDVTAEAGRGAGAAIVASAPAGSAPLSADRRLSPELADRARAFASEDAQPVPPRAASTVALLRDGRTGPEAYLLRRVTSMAFAAGMHVFPGGGVDVRDAEPSIGWAGPAPAQWADLLGTDVPTARELICAAVRETFEESGVLLAGATPAAIVPDTTGDDWEADRLALIDRRLAFAEMLQRRGLALRTDLLRAWSRWVTPEFEPRRYDTFFFVAALPSGQRTRDVGGEADRVEWVRPADAVAAFRSGAMPMLPPTVDTLAGLATASSVAAALALGTDRPMAPILPRAMLAGTDAYLLLPGEDGYDR